MVKSRVFNEFNLDDTFCECAAPRVHICATSHELQMCLQIYGEDFNESFT